MTKGESGTNNLLDQQISANLQRLLVWHSGDNDGLQSQRSRVQIKVSAKKKNWGVTSKVRVRVRGVNGTRVRDGARCMVRGVNRVRDRDRVRCRVRERDGSGCAILFEKQSLPPQKVRNYLVGKN